MSSDDSDWSSAEELEDWSQELTPILCLFCEQTFKLFDETFAHLINVHKLDLIKICGQKQMDSIDYIKLINYIRKTKAKSDEVFHCIESKDYDSEEFMKPVLSDDRFLTFDIESVVNYEENDSVVRSEESLNYEDLSNEQLIHKLKSSDQQIKGLQTQLKEIKDLFNSISPEFVAKGKQLTVGGLSLSEDESYCSSYSHYSIHYEMLSDKIRTKAYEDSILNNKEFFKDKTVLDIGCGTGIISMFAAKAGAQLVVAVDQSDVIFKAIDFAIENKLDSKIKFIKSKLESIDFKARDLPQKYDIIVSEWMGYFLLFEGMLDSILYARDTLLSDSGILIPNGSSLSIAGICDHNLYERYIHFWDNVYGFKMSSMKSNILSEALVENVSKDVINTSICLIKSLDLMLCTLDETHNIESDFHLICKSNDPIIGIVGWFDCNFDVNSLKHKLILSTSPFNESTHWKQTVFLLKTPIESKIGEQIEGRIKVLRNKRDIRSLIVEIEINGKEKQIFYLS